MRIYLCPKKSFGVSVVIPMYNAELYIAECLESLLIQTFQDFEVIVVDDCSTDKSVAIVESYAPKFNGRLRLEKTEKNSGGGGYVPRNMGLNLASGKYVQFLDADDFLLGSALETLYNAAKEYDADVVYTDSYYRLNEPNDVCLYKDGVSKKFTKENSDYKVDLTVDDPNKNLNRLLFGQGEGNFHACWSKFYRREFLFENKISFRNLSNAGDFIFVVNVYCHAKRFLRISTPLYFYRHYNENSITRAVRTPPEQIAFWFSGFVDFVKNLHELENDNEVLSENPGYCFTVFKKHFAWCLNRTNEARKDFVTQEIYEILYREFAKVSSDYTASLLPFLFSHIDNVRKSYLYFFEPINKFKRYFTARIDVNLLPTKQGELKIFSLSDDKATVKKADWLPKKQFGYFIQSYVGNLEFTVKPTVDGQIQLKLSGLDIRKPNDNSKRIPYWIDYTKLTVNDKIIFDKLTPAWHDKSFQHKINVTAGEEIKIQTEWLPHNGEKSDEQENNLILPYRPITCAVSVVISLYNYEKYVGECLDSLLAQTFQDFEVIVVDDCSTDNSVAIVESYVEKFGGRLKFTKTKENSGGGGIPRNKGLGLASGEYVFFMDADDTLTKTGLEEMYTLAKNYGADVVYCEKYFMSEGTGQEFKDNIHPADARRTQKPPFVREPTFETNDLAERIKKATGFNYWVTPWLRLVQRKLLIENNIVFDSLIGSNDVGWTFRVMFCSKRFLRVPNACYIRRMHNESTSLRERTIAEYVHKWMDRSIRSLKDMDAFMSGIEFFKSNPKYRYEVIESFIKLDFSNVVNRCSNLLPYDIYNIFRENFGDYLGKNDVLVSMLCAYAFNQNKTATNIKQQLRDPLIYKLNPYITARLDFKFTSKDKDDFQIVSVSDDSADIRKPSWLQKNGVGYQIQSYTGDIEIIAKATADGQISLDLRSADIRDPADKTKRIPYWIDYTKLIINGKILFDTITPIWHDKPYLYDMDVKADEEIKVEIEWLPHRDDTVNLSAGVKGIQDKSAEKDTLINKLQVTLDNEKKAADKQKVLIAELQTALDTEKKIHSDDAELIRKFSDYFTSRIDLRLVPNSEGKLQIISVSDDKASVRKAGWLPKNESGWFIQSYAGKMEIVAKPTADGQINFDLRGLDVRNPEDKSKRIPYWIDYTKLTVNGEILFEELLPVWHNKPFRYKLDVKADEEIKIEVEWQPHRSDT